MTLAELRALVAEMRALGVTQCDGVVLGPEPVKAAEPPALSTLEERQAQARIAWHEETRDMLAHVGEMSDDACERVRPFRGMA